jgi:hypothetical protein
MTIETAPATQQLFETLAASQETRPESSRKAAISRCKHVAIWYALYRPGRPFSLSDKDAYIKAREAAGAKAAAARVEFDVVRWHLNGGTPAKVTKAGRAAAIASIAVNTPALDNVVQLNSARHDNFVISADALTPKDALPNTAEGRVTFCCERVALWYATSRPGQPLAEADADAYIASRVATGRHAEKARLEFNVAVAFFRQGLPQAMAAYKAGSGALVESGILERKGLDANPAQPVRYLMGTGLRIDENGDCWHEGRKIVRPASFDKALRLTLAQDRPHAQEIDGVPADIDVLISLAKSGATREQIKASIYVAVKSGISLQGRLYDYERDHALVAMLRWHVPDLDTAWAHGRLMGGLYLSCELFDAVAGRVGDSWTWVEYHKFLWGCRERCLRGVVEETSKLCLDGFDSVSRLIESIDAHVALFGTVDEASYKADITPKPKPANFTDIGWTTCPLAHFERVREQFQRVFG